MAAGYDIEDVHTTATALDPALDTAVGITVGTPNGDKPTIGRKRYRSREAAAAGERAYPTLLPKIPEANSFLVYCG